jgi:CRISPR-associated protein Cas2
MDLYCYLVTYDISCPKRWRRVYQTLHGFGEHVQLSVFRCDLTPPRLVRLKIALEGQIHHLEDQVLIVKLGKSTPAVIRGIDVLGRPREFELPGPTIV